MASYAQVLVVHNDSSPEIKRAINSGSANKFLAIQRLMIYFGALLTGARLATTKLATGLLRASGTITFSSFSTANDTIIINGVTFTAVASGATGNQWNVLGSATLQAAEVARAINASVTALVSGYVAASSLAGVLTITAQDPGQAGNGYTIAKGVDAGTVMTVSGARLTAGSNGTVQNHYFGGSALT